MLDRLVGTVTDRLGPGSVALDFGWRDVLFANWPVDPEIVDAHLPDSLDVETHRGDAWLSVVAFNNVDTRPRGLPAALGVDVPEVNLRTYVTAGGEPGVYFFNLDVPSRAVAFGARLTHHLPYYHATVDCKPVGDEVRVRHRRRHRGARPARFAADCEPTGEPFQADPDSLAEFLTERRRLYTESPSGQLRHTDVTHPSWTLYPATVEIGTNTLHRASGFPDPDTAPRCYYSPGVDVTTTRSQVWAPGRRTTTADRQVRPRDRREESPAPAGTRSRP